MKAAYGTWFLFVIAILFITLFATYLSASVNYSKSIRVKNEIINMIERANGFTESETLPDIAEYLGEVSHRTTGECDEDGWVGYGITSAGSTFTDPVLCIKTVTVDNNNVTLPNTVYYQVRIFYQMDIPIVSGLFRFNIEGSTKNMIVP